MASNKIDFPLGVSHAHPAAARGAILSATPNWLQAVAIIRKHWRVSRAFAAVVLLTVITGTLLMKPVYEPTARLEIDPPGAEFFTTENTASDSGNQEYLDTEAKNLESDELALSVIKALHLDKKAGLPSQAAAQEDQTHIDGNTTSGLTAEENAALRAFHKSFKVRRDSTSRIITVSFASHDPRLSATVVNTALQMFVDSTYQHRHDSIVKSSAWLGTQLEDIRKKLDESNRALAAFQQKTGITDIDESKSTFSERMAELSRQQSQAEADRVQLRAELSNVHGKHLDALTEVHTNPVIQDLEKKLAEAKAELKKTKVIYGESHPNVKKLRSEADELQAQLNDQRASILLMLKSNYNAAGSREQALNAEMKAARNKLNQMAQYSQLKKEVQTNAGLYNDLYKKVKESAIAAGAKLSDMQIVDHARVLDRPTRPNIPLDLALGLLTASAGGIMLAFVCEAFDRRLYTVQDVQKLVGSSAVSLVPALGAGVHGPERKFLGMLQSAKVPDKFLQKRPRSPESEALRALHTAIMLSRREDDVQIVAIASSFAREGKTTVAVNLAIALAQYGPTCLIDADLRRPQVAKAFQVPREPGLGELLSNHVPLEEALHPVSDIENLKVLPAGAEVQDTAAAICSDRMRDVLRELRGHFHFVVMDCPPILPYADGRVLSTLADGIIFVCRSGVTTSEALLHSQDILKKLEAAPVLEVVLNGASLDAKGYNYAYE
ncbi:MAG: hypothetical protein DMG69_21035 [Acidobacteria bacterium]|nr:MAG: hypothetical protein DMG69_21035 [Acidobacteriota bacterium]